MVRAEVRTHNENSGLDRGQSIVYAYQTDALGRQQPQPECLFLPKEHTGKTAGLGQLEDMFGVLEESRIPTFCHVWDREE